MDAKRFSCFKAYDIRGRVNADLTLELVRQIGLAYAAEFAPKTVCLGYDARTSSLDFARVLASALQDGGAELTCLGLCGTEEVYFAAGSQGFDGGIMVTASHNPKDWNGLKLVGQNAVPIHSENGLLRLKQRILSGNLPIALRRGTWQQKNFRKDYVAHLLGLLGPPAQHELAPLRIVANAGNGCAWLALNELGKHLPCTLIPIQEKPDGNFPHGVPNPLLPENRARTSEAVLKHKADFGLAWDGDFDRCFFFDEQGHFIESYYIVGLLAQNLLKNSPESVILHDPRLIWNTQDIVRQAGGKSLEVKAGHAFMKDRLRKENALYGGEMSAHHYFKDFYYCDSGMLPWLYVYQLLSRTKQTLSSLLEERIRQFPVSGEINRRLSRPEQALKAVEDAYAPQALACSYLDGLSMEFPEWRFNLRPSNTEALLRLNVESRHNQALLQNKTDALLQLLAAFG